MFIENLRHVRKRNKIIMIVLVVLIIAGLLVGYGFMGNSVGGSADGTYTERMLHNAASTVKTYSKEIKKDANNTTALAGAANGYLNLAGLQDLLLDESGAKKSYNSAIQYANKLIEVYESGVANTGTDGEATEIDWNTPYSVLMQANVAIGDVEASREIFKSSWENVGANAEYATAYGTAMTGAKEYAAGLEDLEAYKAAFPDADEAFTQAVDTAVQNLSFSQMIEQMNSGTNEGEEVPIEGDDPDAEEQDDGAAGEEDTGDDQQ